MALAKKMLNEAKKNQLMEAACKGLIDAYSKAGDGDSVDWSDLDAALEIAKQALPKYKGKTND